MKNSNLHGAGTVFRYTVQQHYKTRSVIIFLTVLFVIALSALPIAALVSGQKKESTETGIRTLYLRNDTEFALDTEALFADARYSGLKLVETDEDDAALNAHLSKESDAAASVIGLDAAGYSFLISTNYGREGGVSHADAASLNILLEDILHQSLLNALSVTEEQEAMIHTKAVGLSQVVS